MSKAVKLKRPRVQDPRLIVGIFLVIISVVATTMLVRSYDRTTLVLQAREAIVAGTALSDVSFDHVEVNLGQAQSHYLAADSDIEAVVSLRDLAAGELVPRAALGSTEEVTDRPIPFEVDRVLAAMVERGDYVDIWWQDATAEQEHEQEPELVVARAPIWYSSGSTSSIGSTTATVYVVIAADLVPTILAAQQREGVLSLLPVVGESR